MGTFFRVAVLGDTVRDEGDAGLLLVSGILFIAFSNFL